MEDGTKTIQNERQPFDQCKSWSNYIYETYDIYNLFILIILCNIYFLQNNVFERLVVTKVDMEQPYWAGIHDSLVDGIQFVENHARLSESTKGSPQRPTKKKTRFFLVLDTQIRIPIPQPHPPTSPPR